MHSTGESSDAPDPAHIHEFNTKYRTTRVYCAAVFAVFQKGQRQIYTGNSVNSQPSFEIFFTDIFAIKFAVKELLKIHLHLVRVATLPAC